MKNSIEIHLVEALFNNINEKAAAVHAGEMVNPDEALYIGIYTDISNIPRFKMLETHKKYDPNIMIWRDDNGFSYTIIESLPSIGYMEPPEDKEIESEVFETLGECLRELIKFRVEQGLEGTFQHFEEEDMDWQMKSEDEQILHIIKQYSGLETLDQIAKRISNEYDFDFEEVYSIIGKELGNGGEIMAKKIIKLNKCR